LDTERAPAPVLLQRVLEPFETIATEVGKVATLLSSLTDLEGHILSREPAERINAVVVLGDSRRLEMPVKKAGGVPARATNLKDVPRDIAGFVQALHQESELSRREIIGISIEQKPPQWRVPEQRTDSRGTDPFRVDRQGIAPRRAKAAFCLATAFAPIVWLNLKPFQSRYLQYIR
jgi:hypothetical protein